MSFLQTHKYFISHEVLWSSPWHSEGHRTDASREPLHRIELNFQTLLSTFWLLAVEGNSYNFLLLLYGIQKWISKMTKVKEKELSWFKLPVGKLFLTAWLSFLLILPNMPLFTIQAGIITKATTSPLQGTLHITWKSWKPAAKFNYLWVYNKTLFSLFLDFCNWNDIKC